MFGIANQLLACAALAVATTVILREGKRRAYAWVTLGPLMFVGGTTVTAGVESVFLLYLPMARDGATRIKGIVNVTVTCTLLVLVTIIICGSVLRWRTLLLAKPGELSKVGA
jgi:carbon starvation protein